MNRSGQLGAITGNGSRQAIARFRNKVKSTLESKVEECIVIKTSFVSFEVELKVAALFQSLDWSQTENSKLER